MTPKDSDSCIVVDTNVFAVADGLHENASTECVAACVKLLRRIQDNDVIVAVDSAASGELVFNEYLASLKTSHKSGLGLKLAIQLWRRRNSPGSCRMVDITPVDPPGFGFAEVPSPLADFDPDDHKWIAVAVAEGSGPPIFQALDKEWWKRRTDFSDCNVDVQFLCAPDLV